MRWKLENLANDPRRHWRDSKTEPPPANRRLLFHIGRFVFVGIIDDSEGGQPNRSSVVNSELGMMPEECIARWSYIRKDAGRAA